MEENQVQELLHEIRAENEIERVYLKKQLNMMKIIMAAMSGIFLLLFVAVVILVPKVTDTLSRANHAIGQISETLIEVDEVFDSVNGLIEESEEGLSVAIDSMNSIDFDRLNQSIEDLGNVVAPLANFFSKFR